MQQLNLTQKFRDIIEDFIERLKNAYQEELVSVILYGSAASGEFAENYSNINLLVVLKNGGLENLTKVSTFINKSRFRIIRPIFFTGAHIKSSLDVFPIEFLDMKENYLVLFGKDVLGDIKIGTANLRFQCEQELRQKLLNLKQLYIRIDKNKVAIKNLLFKSFTSVLHILRMFLGLKGKPLSYLKQEIIKDLSQEFKIDVSIWQRILAAKNKRIKLSNKETQNLFFNFVADLELIVNAIDKF